MYFQYDMNEMNWGCMLPIVIWFVFEAKSHTLEKQPSAISNLNVTI
jgi:hypothetical protein